MHTYDLLFGFSFKGFNNNQTQFSQNGKSGICTPVPLSSPCDTLTFHNKDNSQVHWSHSSVLVLCAAPQTEETTLREETS